MDSIKALFTAVGSVTGGRNGHGEAEDHSVSVNLSVPKAMGGPGRPNTTTPEHLFAVGYAACFGGALDFVAVQKKKNAKGATVTCSVSIGPRDAGGFGRPQHIRNDAQGGARGDTRGACEDRNPDLSISHPAVTQEAANSGARTLLQLGVRDDEH